MTGLLRSIRLGPIGPSPSSSDGSRRPGAESDLRSYPPQKQPPAPLSTAASASPSFSKARNASRSAAAVSGSTAFRASGRLMMTVVTGPSFSTRTFMGRGSFLSIHYADNRAREPRAAPHRRAAVAQLLGLHGLALAAVGDRVEAEVRPHRIHLHQVVLGVGHDAAIPIEPAELAIPDLVHLACRDAEVLAALGDGGDPVADEVVPVVYLRDDVARGPVAAVEDGVGHADQGHQRRIRGLPVTVGVPPEDRRRLPAVHEALDDAPVDVDHAPGRRALVVVLVVAVTGKRGIRIRADQRGG